VKPTVIRDADGVQIITHADHETGGVVVETLQNVAPILEFNRNAQLMSDGFSEDRDLKATHEIPIAVLDHIKTVKGINWMDPTQWKDALREVEAMSSGAFRCSYDNHDPHIIVKGVR
jgi:hypothetical protein